MQNLAKGLWGLTPPIINIRNFFQYNEYRSLAYKVMFAFFSAKSNSLRVLLCHETCLLNLKMHQNAFGGRALTDPAGKLIALLSWINGRDKERKESRK